MAEPHLTPDEVEALVRAHLLAGYGYTQVELDAGTVSPEDSGSVRKRVREDMKSRGIETPDREEVREKGTWGPVG